MDNYYLSKLKSARKAHRITTTQQCLFYELIRIGSKFRHKVKMFRYSNNRLAQNLGISRVTLTAARKRLQEIGLIIYKYQFGEVGTYILVNEEVIKNKKVITNTPLKIDVGTLKYLPGTPLKFYPYINIIYIFYNKYKEEKEIKKEKELFEIFRKRYPGVKRGLDTEYANFKAKHPDYQKVLPLLLPAIQKQMEWKENREDRRMFVADYPHLQTWINQRRWENELPNDSVY